MILHFVGIVNNTMVSIWHHWEPEKGEEYFLWIQSIENVLIYMFKNILQGTQSLFFLLRLKSFNSYKIVCSAIKDPNNGSRLVPLLLGSEKDRNVHEWSVIRESGILLLWYPSVNENQNCVGGWFNRSEAHLEPNMFDLDLSWKHSGFIIGTNSACLKASKDA
jgi:hypothetical protein